MRMDNAPTDDLNQDHTILFKKAFHQIYHNTAFNYLHCLVLPDFQLSSMNEANIDIVESVSGKAATGVLMDFSQISVFPASIMDEPTGESGQPYLTRIAYYVTSRLEPSSREVVNALVLFFAQWYEVKLFTDLKEAQRWLKSTK